MIYKNRIAGSDNVPPKQLIPNAKNFRKHPKNQVLALAGALDQNA